MGGCFCCGLGAAAVAGERRPCEASKPVLGVLRVILSHQHLDVRQLFMQVVIPLLLLQVLTVLLCGLILPQDLSTDGVVFLRADGFIPEALVEVTKRPCPLFNIAM